ncbi:MAG TPA: type II secretion system protein [Verrucomicrobiota bacterium]|nr:type II secretion system protein [Verrucomicrobiota bacterium]
MKLLPSNPCWSSSFSLFPHTFKRELQQSSRQSAFTMVEIAIALAVIGFALVAIIGVLPTGLNVQQQNREETIINQDASIFINAIRNGDRGLDELTNYVIVITNQMWRFNVTDTSTNLATGSWPDTRWYRFDDASPGNAQRLTNGMRIVGLLGKQRIEPIEGGYYSNSVTAFFRALSGAATEKFPQADGNMLNMAFAYRLVPELSPLPTPEVTDFTPTFDANLHELRLRFSWPLLPNGIVGNGRQTFRTIAGGSFERVNNNALTNLHFLRNQTFVTAP